VPLPDLRWNAEKNEWLRGERGVTFEDVAAVLGSVGALADIPHPNAARYPNQRVLVVEIRGEVYMVPYVGDQQTRFLKTIYPSRKARRSYGKAKTTGP
jgi:hypothetical protein